MKLILVRHGETIENANGLVQGRLPGRLSEKGKAQVEKAADRLRSEKIDVMLSSDLGRAHQTAHMLAEACDIPLIFDTRLRERSYGIYEGRPFSVLLDCMHQEKKDYFDFCAEGGESYEELAARVTQWLEATRDRYGNATVLAVTHNGVLKILLNLLFKRKIETNGIDAIANGDIVIINIAKDGRAQIEATRETLLTSA